MRRKPLKIPYIFSSLRGENLKKQTLKKSWKSIFEMIPNRPKVILYSAAGEILGLWRSKTRSRSVFLLKTLNFPGFRLKKCSKIRVFAGENLKIKP